MKLPESYIESVHAKMFRQFESLNVHFNKGFNFIAGPNGCGKTSVLACVSHCFHHGNYKYSRFSADSSFWTDILYQDSKYRVGLEKGSINAVGYRASSIRQWINPPVEDGRYSLSTHEVKARLGSFCPLFIGAQRNIKYKQISGMTREKTVDQQLDNYLAHSTQSLHGDASQDIKQWMVNRYFIIEKDWAKEEKANWDHMVNSLPALGPFDSNFSYVRTERDLEPVFSIYGRECYLEELSSGFQAILLIISNIFEWVETSNLEGFREVVNATGTVLIDELDLHLHPEWQFTLRDGLERIFPKLQFIVTTHSPHLLASAKKNEIIIMPKIQPGEEYVIEPSPIAYSGWSTDQILSEIMGVKSLENKDYEKLIRLAFDAVESKSTNDLSAAINTLELVAHPSDTIITVLKARLASMVATEND